MNVTPRPVLIFFISLSVVACEAPPLGWEYKARLPDQLQNGLEIAHNDFGRRRASLSIVCDIAGSTRLFFHTRLPVPESMRRESIRYASDRDVSSDDSASIFVGGIGQEIVIPVAVSRGEPLDEIISAPLSAGAVANLAVWYGNKAPAKVSVVGIDETGVRMRTKGSGANITKFWSACRPSADIPT